MLNASYDPPEFSAVELFMEGRAKEQEDHQSAETAKLGTLRGGSPGMLLPDGSVLGTSPWKVLARYLGYQLPIPTATHNIFDGGRANEMLWERYLTSRGTNFTGEEKYPLTYEISDVKVTGRPDIVILQKKGDVPVFGVENKGIMSEGTAADVFLGDKPKDDNLIQSCHYSYKFGLPWILVYSAYSVYAPGFFTKRKYDVDTIPPQHKEFKIGCNEGKFYIVSEDGTVTNTLITAQGIEDFYMAIIESARQKDISWMRMATHDVFGNERPYDLNDYDDICLLVSPNTSYDNWLRNVEKACSQSKYIKAKKVNKKMTYKVLDDGQLLDTFDTVEEAREFIFGER